MLDYRSGAIEIEVVMAWPDEARVRRVELHAEATVADALAACGCGLPEAGVAIGIFGREAEPGHRLRDGDRVEIYRPLTADPKLARRRRADAARRRKSGG